MNLVIEPLFYPSGRLHAVCMICLTSTHQVVGRVGYAFDTDDSEWELLRQIKGTFHNNANARLCGWDSRVKFNKILGRCFYHGIAFPWYYADRFGPRYRYSVEHHLDIKDFFTEYGLFKGETFTRAITQTLGFDEVWIPKEDDTPTLMVFTGIMCTILTLRCDLVRGALTSDMHNTMIKQLFIAMEASLDSDQMQDRAQDALGITYAYPDYASAILPVYRAMDTGFTSIPLVRTDA